MWGSKPPWRSGEIPKALWPAQGFRDIRISFFASPTITWVTWWWHPNWECRQHENNPTISQFACPGFLLMSLYFICRYMYPVHFHFIPYVQRLNLWFPLYRDLNGATQRTPSSSASETYVMAKRISSEPGRSACDFRETMLFPPTAEHCRLSPLCYQKMGCFIELQEMQLVYGSYQGQVTAQVDE